MNSFISTVRSLINRDKMLTTAFLIFSLVLMATAVSASTTISTDINTQGQLTVTGTSTLMGKVGIGTSSTGYALTVSPSNTGIGLYASDGSLQADIESFGNSSTTRSAGFNFKGVSGASGIGADNWTIFRYNAASNKIYMGDTGSVSWLQSGHDFYVRAGLGAISNPTTTPQFVIEGATGSVGIATTSPVANLQVANGSATTTVELGSANQNVGTCIKLYRSDGSAIYATVAAGATTFTLSTSACATVTGF